MRLGLKREPVAYGGLLTIITSLAAGYGLDLTTEQLAAIIAVVQALVTWFQRRQVAPVA